MNATDPDREVPPEERIKGYRYGRTLVLFNYSYSFCKKYRKYHTYILCSLKFLSLSLFLVFEFEVPFSKIDEEALKYHTEPCLKLIGFCPVTSVPRILSFPFQIHLFYILI